MKDEKKFHVGVKGFIVNDEGKVLLMEEDGSTHREPTDNYWDLPGGRVQEGESVLQTLAREIEEETGFTDISEPTFYAAVISNHEIPLKNGEIVGLVLMVYKVGIPREAQVKLSSEHAGYEWVDIEVARERLQNKYPKDFTDQL